MDRSALSLRVLAVLFCCWARCGSALPVNSEAGDGAETGDCRIRERISRPRHTATYAAERESPQVFDFRDNILLKCAGACRHNSRSSSSKVQSTSASAPSTTCSVEWTLERPSARRERDAKQQPLANVLHPNRFCISKKRLQLSGKFLAKNSGTLRCLVDGAVIQSWDISREKHSREVFVKARTAVVVSPTTPPVPRPLVFTKLPEYMSVVGRGATLRLSCAASGYPRPIITWLKGYTVIGNSGRVHVTTNDTLVITSVTRSDDNTYRCVAANQSGHITRRCLVYVM